MIDTVYSKRKLIAELPRAKRASEAPYLIEIGNPSSREKFGYDVTVRANFGPSVQTLGEGEESLEVTRTGEQKNAIFSWRDF